MNSSTPERSAGSLLLFRADASTEIGAGHVMRALALADAFQRRGGRCLFALNREAEPLHEMLIRRDHEVTSLSAPSGSPGDIESVSALCRERGAVALIVDGSFAGLDYERELAARGVSVVAIDDGAGRETAALVLVNPNAGAERADYHCDRPGVRLCGPRYALLRPEFVQRRRRRRPTASPHPCVLISFGGSDPAGGTARALDCLPDSPKLRVIAVLGAQQARTAETLEAAERAARRGHAVEVMVSPPDMAALMTAADAAISAGGGTLLELAHLGCPALAFVVADNQSRGCRALAAAGCLAGGEDLRELGDAELSGQIAAFLADPGRRRASADRARKLVDGLGASRVLERLQHYLSGQWARPEASA